MDSISYNCEIIQDYIKRKGISVREFCRTCGISYCHYRKVLNQDGSISIDTLFKIARFLKIPFDSMFTIDQLYMFEDVELYN